MGAAYLQGYKVTLLKLEVQIVWLPGRWVISNRKMNSKIENWKDAWMMSESLPKNFESAEKFSMILAGASVTEVRLLTFGNRTLALLI